VALIAALRAARPADQRYKLLPDGEGWLFIETGGGTGAEAEATARAVAARAAQTGGTSRIVTDPAEMRTLWGIREAGAGILTAARTAARPGPAGKTLAVPPGQLGAYLREFRKLMDDHGRRAPTTGISATAACISGSTSTWSPRPASPVSGALSRRPLTWSRHTGDRCPASTVTGRPFGAAAADVRTGDDRRVR